MNQNIKILVCCHKQDVHADMPPYCPIHVGKALSDVQLDMICDNQGEDNISFKNQSYCELTGMYWAWKNLKNVDIIGLCHYRRYFDFHGTCGYLIPYKNIPVEKFKDCNITVPQNIINKINNGDIVVARPFYSSYNLIINYSLHHISDDIRVLQDIIRSTQPRIFVDAFRHVMYNRNYLIPYNMFIMRWADFDEYCNWLFPLLEKVECKIDISHYNQFQTRIYGFMAERLFNVWLYATKKHLIYKPIIRISEENNISTCKYIVNAIRGKLALLLTYQRHWI